MQVVRPAVASVVAQPGVAAAQPGAVEVANAAVGRLDGAADPAVVGSLLRDLDQGVVGLGVEHGGAILGGETVHLQFVDVASP